MPKFKVVATMDVGYVTEIEADNEGQAWVLANLKDDGWDRLDEGHDFTIEGVYKMEDTQ